MHIQELHPSEYSEYDAYYIGLVQPGQLIPLLSVSGDSTFAFFSKSPLTLHNYSYAPGKWTIKDVLQHLIDVERIFSYRMLRFARADSIHLPGFEVDQYGQIQDTSNRSMARLAEEFLQLRKTTLMMLGGFSPTELKRKGTASELTASVRALGFKLVGHDLHHCQVVKERYLTDPTIKLPPAP